jgi:hypothetical protein
MNLRNSAVIFFLACLLVVAASGQTQPNLENGFKPYGSYDGGSLDTVNIMNGNLMLHAPLLPSGSSKDGKRKTANGARWTSNGIASRGSDTKRAIGAFE